MGIKKWVGVAGWVKKPVTKRKRPIDFSMLTPDDDEYYLGSIPEKGPDTIARMDFLAPKKRRRNGAT